MDRKIYDTYVAILKRELRPALGCTEPIAIAYAAAKARSVLGCMPEKVALQCSGSIIKNVKAVIVPNSGGLKGIPVAAMLGIVGGDAERELEVLQSVTAEHIETAKQMLSEGICSYDLATDPDDLYILVDVAGQGHTAQIEIKTSHTNITKIVRDGEVLLAHDKDCAESQSGEDELDMGLLNVRDILTFANEVKLGDVEETLNRQIECNTAIAQEGMTNDYGSKIGKSLLKHYDSSDVRVRAKAMAAAGSDARMSGCAMPVVINSGSGNQGMTVSLPVIEYAKELGASHEQLLRALTLANLVALHQKRYIGALSAFCGAVCAGAASGCGIAYLHGAGYEEISGVIVNTLANVGGIVCDGAKPSCAAKIAAAVDAAIMGWNMSRDGDSFCDGDGLVKESVESTIESITRMGREGMKSTNIEILNIMVGK